jgi:hypothetical protein
MIISVLNEAHIFPQKLHDLLCFGVGYPKSLA